MSEMPQQPEKSSAEEPIDTPHEQPAQNTPPAQPAADATPAPEVQPEPSSEVPPETDAGPVAASNDQESGETVQPEHAETAPAEIGGAEAEATQDTADTAESGDQSAGKPKKKKKKKKNPFGFGTLHTARVSRVTNEEVYVDLDGRQGKLALEEFAQQPLPAEGDQVAVAVENVEEDGGLFVLTRRDEAELAFWQAVQPGDSLEGVVTGMNKGGLDVDIGGARAFLPASQVDTRHIRDISDLIGEHVTCVVTQVDRATMDLVVSRRKFIEKDRKEKRRQAIETLVEGEKRTGKVSNITDYGAFVDLGGVDGLLHVTDMSWGRISHPSEVVQKDQEIELVITKVDRDKGKVSLSLKQAQPDPWSGVEEKYAKGTRLKGKVLRLADFGAFVELEPGVEALLPSAELTWAKGAVKVSDFVQPGQEVESEVIRCDAKKRRISLSLKAMQENPWTGIAEKFPTGEKFPGKVSKIMDFGAFVELAPGVEGLIHISELSTHRVRSVADAVKEGQEVEVRVLKIDTEQQRISLSMKPPEQSPAESDRSGRPKKARKKPLRGGLSSHFDFGGGDLKLGQ